MTARREFIKQACAACAAVAGFGILLSDLESCKTAEVATVHVTKNQVTVPLSLLKDKNLLLINNPSLDFDVVFVKRAQNDFLALQMVCPHRRNPVEVTPNGFLCPSHGSTFDKDGNVTKGPAEQGLKKFPVSVDKGVALITLV